MSLSSVIIILIIQIKKLITFNFFYEWNEKKNVQKVFLQKFAQSFM